MIYVVMKRDAPCKVCYVYCTAVSEAALCGGYVVECELVGEMAIKGIMEKVIERMMRVVVEETAKRGVKMMKSKFTAASKRNSCVDGCNAANGEKLL